MQYSTDSVNFISVSLTGEYISFDIGDASTFDLLVFQDRDARVTFDGDLYTGPGIVNYEDVRASGSCNAYELTATRDGKTESYGVVVITDDSVKFPRCLPPNTLEITGIEVDLVSSVDNRPLPSEERSSYPVKFTSPGIPQNIVNLLYPGAYLGLTIHLPGGVSGSLDGTSGNYPQMFVKVWAVPGCNQYDMVLTNQKGQSKTIPILLNGVAFQLNDCSVTGGGHRGTTTTTTTTADTSSTPFLAAFAPSVPSDNTPPHVVSMERTGNATSPGGMLEWTVTFSESVRVDGMALVNHTSMANATIPDMGAVRDTILVDVPGNVTGGTVAVDLDHQITTGLRIELVAPDCTRYTIHDQTFAWLYELRQPRAIEGVAGVAAAGPWTLEITDMAKWIDGTLNSWNLILETDGRVQGSGTTYTFTQYADSDGPHALDLEPYMIRDLAGNPLADVDPDVSEPYVVVGAGAPTC